MLETVDLTGLSPDSIRMVESLVLTLRTQEAKQSWSQRDPDGWSAALQRWVDRHPKRDITIDDSRDTIFLRRGE